MTDEQRQQVEALFYRAMRTSPFQGNQSFEEMVAEADRKAKVFTEKVRFILELK